MRIEMHERDNFEDKKLRLGIICTALLGSAYLAFSLCAAFAATALATPIQPDSPVTWAFIAGLGVILFGFVLTCIYAWITNQQDQQISRTLQEIATATGEGEVK